MSSIFARGNPCQQSKNSIAPLDPAPQPSPAPAQHQPSPAASQSVSRKYRNIRTAESWAGTAETEEIMGGD